MSEKVEHTELRKLAEAATPGPWECERHDMDDGSISFEVWNQSNKHYGRISTFNDEYDNKNSRCNAAFIAVANPETVLALLAERDRLREVLKEIQEIIGKRHSISESLNDAQDMLSAIHWMADTALKDTNQ